LFLKKNFNYLNAKTAAITSSFSKFSKLEDISVSGARNKRQKQAPENGQCVMNLTYC